MNAVNPAATHARLTRRRDTWRLPARRPFAFPLPADPAALRNAGGYQRTLVDDLRHVVDRITDQHWLRVFAHGSDFIREVRRIADPAVPTYLPVEVFVRAGQFEADAQQELWQREVGDSMPALALAALIWNEEKYRTALRGHVLAACDYPSWGNGPGARNRDLSCAHLARGIAVARDWLPDLWSAGELERMRLTVESRVAETLLGLYGGCFWSASWMDNHCHCSLASLAICGTIYFEEIDAAPEWLAAAEIGLENVMRHCHVDGSSHEGLPYWSYGTSFLLQAIEGTRGVTGFDRFYEADYLRHAFAYRLNSSTPALGGTLPFGDAVEHDYYGPAFLLNALARQYRDPHAQWLAQHIAFEQTGGPDCEVWNLLWHDPTLAPERPAVSLDCHFDCWDVAVSRSGWTANDYVLAIKSGYTNRNHSHLDAGALALAWGDEWLLTAPGYGEVGPGFWDAQGRRWNYYSNSTESHTTLLINGRNQRSDPEARGAITAFETGPETTRTVIDLTGAYAGARRVQREVVHRRGVEILVTDEVELDEPGAVEWLLQPGGEVTLQNGAVLARGVRGSLEARMQQPALPFAPRAPTRPCVDVPLARIQTHSVRQEGQRLRFVCRLTVIDHHRGHVP